MTEDKARLIDTWGKLGMGSAALLLLGLFGFGAWRTVDHSMERLLSSVDKSMAQNAESQRRQAVAMETLTKQNEAELENQRRFVNVLEKMNENDRLDRELLKVIGQLKNQ